MKRKLLSLIAVALIGGTASAQCDLTLNETDSWGDGWNGNEVAVTINGTTTNYTLGGGASGTETITVNDGDVVSIDYLGGGSFNSEVGFTVTDPNGGVLASDTDPAIQNYFTGVISCAGNCAWPTLANSPVQNLNDVDLEWTTNGAETSWTLEYGVAPMTPGSGTSVVLNTGDVTIVGSSITYNLTGLPNSTMYEFIISADCGSSVLSHGSFGSFETVNPCPSPSGLTATVISPDSVGLVWTAGANGETEWIVEYGTTGFTPGTGTTVVVTTNPNDTIEPLVQNTDYDFYVQGVCSVSDTSFFIGPISATTGLFCNNVSGISATTVADSAFLSWTPGVDGETSWNIEYGPVGFTAGTGTMYTTSNNPDTLTGLMLSSSYDFYVQAACAGGDTSLFEGPTSFYTPLGNDDGCDALELPVDGVVRVYNNVNGTSQGVPVSSTGGGATVWFYFVYPNASGVDVSLCGSSFDTKLYAFERTDCGDVNSYTEIAYNDDDCGLSSQIQVCGTPGDTIAIMVDGYGGGDEGNFNISLTGLVLNAGTGTSVDVCAGDTLNLWNQVTGQVDNSGMWTYPQNPTVVYNDSLAQTGAMSLVGNDFYYIMSNACGADTATVTVNAFTAANAGTAVSPFEVCNWGNIYLYDGLSGTIDFGGSWSDNTGTGLLTGASLQVSALNAGSYGFTYTASNGVCPDATTTITVDVLNCTSIEEFDASNVSVYPNPSTGVFTVEYAGTNTNVELSILDINGKVVYSQIINSNKTNIELSTIANGVYTVVLVSNDSVSTTKMVVAK